MNNVINIDNVLVRKEILEAGFVCDLKKCKGACCTMESEFGAPLLEEEIDIISELLPEINPYLSENGREEIGENGFWEEKNGELMTKSINNKNCVFVVYEGQIAKCGIEKAFNDGKINFKKPLSCHLFPIRVSKFGGDILRFEKLKECEPALEKGNAEDVSIVEFCREPLERLYGKSWFNKLIEYKRK
jgi:hypothetical protein